MRTIILLLIVALSKLYGQQVSCNELNAIHNISQHYQDYLGEKIADQPEDQYMQYELTFLPDSAKKSIIKIDSTSRQMSLFFYFDYFKSLENGKSSYSKLKKIIGRCLRGYKILKLDEQGSSLGCAFYSNRIDDDELSWFLGLGELVKDNSGRSILFIALVKEW